MANGGKAEESEEVEKRRHEDVGFAVTIRSFVSFFTNQAAPFIVASLLILLSGVATYHFFPSISEAPEFRSALILSRMTVVSLTVIVALMAGLAIIYSLLKITKDDQALGLPEGSVRALIAFSLVLSFVCMSSFLQSGLSGPEIAAGGGDLKGVRQSQVDDLRAVFVVAAQPLKNVDGTPLLDPKDQSQLYDVKYFSKRSKEGDDFSNQVFTTLATVFVTVVGFYFGSSTTSSAIATAKKSDPSSGGGQPRAPIKSDGMGRADTRGGGGGGATPPDQAPGQEPGGGRAM
ncbi:hypothetical protein [uncultured Methylobacterium sp.]|uniref:hypothetical protein n=1 Tax=uncultured Methylobacterium sp. TaxID=157278 RepID=UPI002591416C|nr:hypothetical protein [uncultured Methylobacterium sp.]